VTSEHDGVVAADGPETPPAPPGTSSGPGILADRRVQTTILIVVAMVFIDIFAILFVPPFPKGGEPGDACAYPVCFIGGTLELPPPHVVIDLDPSNPMPTGSLVVTFHPSITNTIITMWIVSIVLVVALLVVTRTLRLMPRAAQNAFEWIYESLEGFGVSIGGEAARPYVPLFIGLLLYILLANWSGLVPPIGRIEELRAPTSDVNITIGLALVAFVFFEFKGFQANGVRGYLGRFFPLRAFREGVVAGFIALFVGLIELMLEFVKPVTLSMRLFGNIYGGEVALGVITALTLAIVPPLLLSLELMLNFIQALIFSVLTLIFTVLAVESHEEEEAHGAELEAALESPAAATPGGMTAIAH